MNSTRSPQTVMTWLLPVALFAASTGVSAQIRSEQNKLAPSTLGADDRFGRAVAISGNHVLGSTLPGTGTGAGSNAPPGEVLLLNATTGQQLATLIASNATGGDSFGQSLDADGQLAIIGAPFADGLRVDTGSAYVFDLQSMQEISLLNAIDGATGDGFGNDVVLDGNRALIGACCDDDNGAGSGSAYIFDAMTGQQLLKIKPTIGLPGSFFGSSVALNGALAAIATSASQVAMHPTSVYVFDSTTGVQLHQLTPNIVIPGEQFGHSVAIQNGLIFVGAPTSNNSFGARGSVYVFDGATGQELSPLLPTSSSGAYLFGRDLAASNGRIAVTALVSHTSGWSTGEVYLFDASSASLITQLVANEPPRTDMSSGVVTGGNALGIDLSYDGIRLATGAPSDSDAGQFAGAVYVFEDTAQNTGQGNCYSYGLGVACSCGFPNLSSGCGNSTSNGAIGSILHATGDALLTNDSLILSASNLPSNTQGLFVQGSLQAPIPVGGGILCTNGAFRHPVQSSDEFGVVKLTGLSANASAGSSITYQFWYRDGSLPCAPGNFNFTNAWTVIW